jgi:sporulation protein YlmC with PRC-barrel domain
MNIVRDCLDKQLVDAQGDKIGRVDGVVLQLRSGKPPVIAFVEVGAVTQAYRLSKHLGKFIERLERPWLSGRKNRYRIPWRDVVPTGVDVTAAIDVKTFPALAWERWLRKKIVLKIPGA